MYDPSFNKIFSHLAISNINTDLKVVRNSNSFSNFIVIINYVSYIESENMFYRQSFRSKATCVIFDRSNIKSLLTDNFNHLYFKFHKPVFTAAILVF